MLVKDVKITAITNEVIQGRQTIDAARHIVAPGLIDSYFYWVMPLGHSLVLLDGALGVIEVGAYTDIFLVDGNPLENINLVADHDKNFDVIMKDGKIYKNTLN